MLRFVLSGIAIALVENTIGTNRLTFKEKIMVATIVYFECPKCGEEMKKRVGDAATMMDTMQSCPKCGEPMTKIKSEVASPNGGGLFSKIFGN